MIVRYLLVALAGAAALLLTSCGGSGSTSSSTSASVSAPTPAPATSPAPAPGSSPGSGETGRPVPKPRQEAAPPQRPHPAPRQMRRAGHAAGFLVPQGDNSVPTYGSEGSASQRRAAEAALAAFLDARAGEEWSAACRYLAASVRDRLEKFAKDSGGKLKGCAPVLDALSSSGSSSSLASPLTHGLASLRVKGQNAFALWLGPGGQKYAMPMAAEGGAWRVTQLAPLPYPPGSTP